MFSLQQTPGITCIKSQHYVHKQKDKLSTYRVNTLLVIDSTDPSSQLLKGDMSVTGKQQEKTSGA